MSWRTYVRGYFDRGGLILLLRRFHLKAFRVNKCQIGWKKEDASRFNKYFHFQQAIMIETNTLLQLLIEQVSHNLNHIYPHIKI